MEAKNEKIDLTPEQLRQLQLNELEMMVEVDRICRKHNIQYSLDGGTLIGAVRHHGFIPWDDDVDMIFTRSEYAKFYRACKKDLDKNRFFLQEYRTDPGYRWGYAKLRRKDTEYIRVNQRELAQKTGVCIDLFVTDHMPDTYLLRRAYYFANFCIRKILYSELGRLTGKNAFTRGWYNLLYQIPKEMAFKWRNVMAGLCNRKPTKLYSHLLFPYVKKSSKYGMPAECFGEYIEIKFEGLDFFVFKDYDKYLRVAYGDYMQLPPPEKRVGCADACEIALLDISLEEIQNRYYSENKRRS